MLRQLSLILLILLAACGRPLAPGEEEFARDLFGDGLDLTQVRVKSGFRGAPKQGVPETTGAPRPLQHRPGVCDRVAPNPVKGPPPAWALYNTVHFSKEFYRADLAPGWPDRLLLPQTLILGHELVHVWQWQQRKRTGYRPIKAGLESVFNADPYFYVPSEGEGFLAYGYEQQAALLEDYLCYALLDPKNERRGKIRQILTPYFQMDRVDQVLRVGG